MINKKVATLLLLFWLLALVPTALAHGVASDVTISDSTITIAARYANGAVMDQAQITIFAPDAPQEEWLVGKVDEQGVFTFDLDNYY